MKPKRILVTGGHSGIGLELTNRLLAEGHHLGLIIRSKERRKEVENVFISKAQLDFFYADFSNQEHVRAVVNDIEKQWDRIDILFNNAGILLGELSLSKQGNEMHYEVNTLAPYMLTLGLRDILERSVSPVIVNTVTDSLDSRKKLNTEELLQPSKFKKLFGTYLQSKFALTLLMNQLTRMREWQNMRIINVSPGPNKTKMTAGNGMPIMLKILRHLFFPKPSKGANLLYQAAFNLNFVNYTGIYVQSNKIKEMAIELTEEQKEHLLSGITIPFLQA